MHKNQLKILPLVLRISICLLLAAIAYQIAVVMMDSLMGFRSPLRDDPPPPDAPLGEPLTRRLVFILADGLRVDTAGDPEVMPALATLRNQGASLTLHSRTPSFSQPGFATLLTGAWPEINDSMVFNAEYEDILAYSQDNLFAAAQRAGVKSGVSGFDWFEKILSNSGVDKSFYTAREDALGDQEVIDAALLWMADPSIKMLFIHLDQIDYAGHHQGGPQNPAWNAAANRVDGLIAEIAAKMDFNQDTLLVVSDHGHIDRGGHGGQDAITLLEPFVLAGKGVLPGEYGDAPMTAVAPTVSVLLGLNLPASAQSAPLTTLLDLPSERLTVIQTAFQLQQAGLAKAYSRAIMTSLEPYILAAGDYQGAIEEARIGRLRQERVPRILIAWGIILVILLFFPWRRWRSWIWLLAGAVVYLLLFNLRYALIEQYSYSFSSLRSQEWVISFFLTTSAASLVAAALLAGWRERWLEKTSGQVVLRVLNLTMVIVFFLALPILTDYAVNGLITRWTLPDLGLQYLAVYCLIQVMLVCALGLTLAGIAAAGVRILRARTAAQAAIRPAGV